MSFVLVRQPKDKQVLLASILEGSMKTLSTSALSAIAAFGTIAVTALSQAQETMTKEKLAGPWQLVSFKTTAGDKVSYPLGEHPIGYIEITPTRVLGYCFRPHSKSSNCYYSD